MPAFPGSQVEVIGQFVKGDGSPITDGRVVFRAMYPKMMRHIRIRLDPVVARLDAEGRFSAMLVPSNDPALTGGQWTFYYLAEVWRESQRSVHYIWVMPKGRPLILSDLIEDWNEQFCEEGSAPP